MKRFSEWLLGNIKTIAVVIVIVNAWALKYDIEHGYWISSVVAMISTAFMCYNIGKAVAYEEIGKQNEESHKKLMEDLNNIGERFKNELKELEDDERKFWYPQAESDMDDQINDALNKK